MLQVIGFSCWDITLFAGKIDLCIFEIESLAMILELQKIRLFFGHCHVMMFRYKETLSLFERFKLIFPCKETTLFSSLK